MLWKGGRRIIRVVQDLTREELDETLFEYYDGMTFAEEDFSDN